MAGPQSGHYEPMVGPWMVCRNRRSVSSLPSSTPYHQLLPISSILLSSGTIYRPSCPIRCVKRYRIIIAVYVGRCSYETLSDHRTRIICLQKSDHTDQGKVTRLYVKINLSKFFNEWFLRYYFQFPEGAITKEDITREYKSFISFTY